MENCDAPKILKGIGLRLREAREIAGLKQSELAEIGQVSRATQVSYEAEETSPNVDYLLRIQGQIDVPFVLYGGGLDSKGGPNWQLIIEVHDEVQLFKMRHAVGLPDRYKWQLMEQLFNAKLEDPEPQAQQFLEAALKAL